MGKFIGCAGAAFILAAAAAVITVFLKEIGVIKDKTAVGRWGKISLAVLATGAAYLFIITLIFNSVKSRTNFFEFDKLFVFLNTEDVLKVCSDFSFRESVRGLMMPLYPLITHLTGRLVFEQYVLTAEFISFASACVSGCLLYSMLNKYTNGEKSADIMMLAASVPYAFMLFAPSYISFTIMLALLGAYSLSKGRVYCFAALALAACLSSKAGLAVFALYPMYKSDVFAKLMKYADSAAFLNNAVIKKIILAVLVMTNGIIMFCLLRGK